MSVSAHAPDRATTAGGPFHAPRFVLRCVLRGRSVSANDGGDQGGLGWRMHG